MQHKIVNGLIVLVCAYAALLIAQLWFDVVSDVVFWKISVTVGVLVVLASGVIAVKHDFKDEEKQRKDRFID
jgi:hypothetical protein